MTSARPADPDAPFWQRKSLADMTTAEWESLCDGCGKCCLLKLEDVDTGEIAYTNVACRLLDLGTCQCSRYAERLRFVPDCVVLSPDNIGDLFWMPKTCAYRAIAEGRDLPSWHPLVSGDPETVHRSGVSIRGRCITERKAGPLEHHVLEQEP
jgi:uncharacterized cysteine cluster protein YcgN (CxxCxxCC family)